MRTPAAASQEQAIWDIALDIERLKGAYPELAELSAAKHCDRQRLTGSSSNRHRAAAFSTCCQR